MLYKVENNKSINKLYVEYLKCVANKSKHKGEPYWQRKMISIHQKKNNRKQQRYASEYIKFACFMLIK